MKKFTGRKSHYLFIITAFLMGGLLPIGFLNIKSHLPIYAKTITIGQPVTLSGTNTISAGQFIDTANTAYFIDPAASGTSLSLNGTAAVSGLNLGGTAVTATGAELNYVHGVTSALQTQLGLKANLASPTFTGTVTVPAPVAAGAAVTKSYADAAGSSALNVYKNDGTTLLGVLAAWAAPTAPCVGWGIWLTTGGYRALGAADCSTTAATNGKLYYTSYNCAGSILHYYGADVAVTDGVNTSVGIGPQIYTPYSSYRDYGGPCYNENYNVNGWATTSRLCAGGPCIVK